jgi:hypothetical protein
MTIHFMHALIDLGCLAILLVVLYGPWQSFCTDATRQVLFEKRDALFDLAAAGRLHFGSREYTAIRSSLQAQIRFAHELTLPRFIVLGVALQASGALSQKSAMDQAIGDIRDPTARADVGRLVTQANRAIFLMLYFKSPVMLMLTPVFFIAILLLAAVKRARRTLNTVERRTATVVQVEAEFAPTGRSRAAAA